MILFIIFILSCLFLIYNYFKCRLNYWKSKKVPYISSNVYKATVTQFYDPVPQFDHYADIYNKLSEYDYGGCFWNFRPQLVIREPELIKYILSKDFEHFRNRGNTNFDERDPLTNHIFSAPGDLWRALRVRLTPTFTSGKMKYMFELVKDCAEEYQRILEKPATLRTPVDLKELSAGYTIEVISSTAFGLKTNSIVNQNSEFKNIGRRIFALGLRFRLRHIIQNWFPILKPFIKVSLFEKKVSEFFFKTVRETVHFRKKTGSRRNDFLQILMNLRDEEKEETDKNRDESNGRRHQHDLEMTTELMTAQCFLFFVAGFDTSSMVLSMTLLELAVNQDIQKKLQDEIGKSIDENGNQITYEMIKLMPYLHKVIQETLRKYPVLSIISRICTKTYRLPNSDLIIDRGTEIIIPTAGMHRDKKYFPDPEKYDPERFNEEETRNRHHFVYLPFGEGPRNCIGSRFGLMSVKLAVVYLLHRYTFETTTETQYPVKFKPHKLLTDCAYPVLLKCSMKF